MAFSESTSQFASQDSTKSNTAENSGGTTRQVRTAKDPILRAFLIAASFLFLAVTLVWWTNNRLWLDDYYLVNDQQNNGFWGPTEHFQSSWGMYRFVYTTLLAPIVFVAAEYPWIPKLTGILMHLGTALLSARVLTRWGAPRVSVALFVALFLVWPYSLEAVAWPSNLGQYPLAPFVLLFGLQLATVPHSSLAIVAGGALMGFATVIHEQVGPLAIGLGLVAVIFASDRRRSSLLLIPLLILSFVNLAGILATRESNIRLSGEYAGSPALILRNIDYLRQLIRTSPFGDLFWYEDGLRVRPLMAVAALLTFLALVIRRRLRPPGNPVNRPPSIDFAIAVLVMAGAYAVCLAPILMSPIPWHTARVIYIPHLALSFSLTMALAALLGALPQRLKANAQLLGFAVSMFLFTWASWSLFQESSSYNRQANINQERAEQAASLVIPALHLRSDTLLVVGGFPGSDVQRPQFGEHIIGMTPGEFRIALGLSVYGAPPVPRFNFASGLDHVCLGDDGRLDLTPAQWTGVHESRAVEEIFFLIYSQVDGWKLFEADAQAPQDIRGRLQECASLA